MTREVMEAPKDSVEFKAGGYTFGLANFESPPNLLDSVPKGLASLADMLRKESKLLQMFPIELPSQQQVLDAYGHDIEFLRDCARDLDECIRQAIRCSVIFQGKQGEDEQKWEKMAQGLWNEITAELPLAMVNRNLQLTADVAAQLPEEILKTLQGQVEIILAEMLNRLSQCMQRLVLREKIGIVTWIGDSFNVCMYHYFCYVVKRKVISERTEKINRQTSPGNGEIAVIRHRQVEKGEYIARHTHHVVNAYLHDLDLYDRSGLTLWFARSWHGLCLRMGRKRETIAPYNLPIPGRIKEFLKNVPPRVRHMLQIVDGHVTNEDVVYKTVEEGIVTESTLMSVYTYDPAVTLGDFVLIGWDWAEVLEERAAWWKKVRGFCSTSLIVCLLLSLLCAGGWGLFVTLPAKWERDRQAEAATQAAQQERQQRANEEAARKDKEEKELAAQKARDEFNAYLAEAEKNGKVMSVARGQKLEMADGPTLFFEEVGLLRNNECQLKFRVARREKGREIAYTLKAIPDTNSSLCYGDVDLFLELGLSLVLHVTRVDQGFIHYTVSKEPIKMAVPVPVEKVSLPNEGF